MASRSNNEFLIEINIFVGGKKSEDGEEDAKDIAVRMTDEDPEAVHPHNDYTPAPST